MQKFIDALPKIEAVARWLAIAGLAAAVASGHLSQSDMNEWFTHYLSALPATN